MNYRVKCGSNGFPPGGWRFTAINSQGHSLWHAPNPMVETLDQTAQRLDLFKKANSSQQLFYSFGRGTQPVSDNSNQDIQNFTASRLNFHVDHCEPVDDEAKKKEPWNAPLVTSPAHAAPAEGVKGGLWQRFKRDTAGFITLARWLIEAGAEPIPMAEAERRAHACAHGRGGDRCQYNVKKSSMESSIAEEIKRQNEIRLNNGLRVSNEMSLGTCELCGCHLPLKIWLQDRFITPIPSAPQWCWIKQQPANSPISDYPEVERISRRLKQVNETSKAMRRRAIDSSFPWNDVFRGRGLDIGPGEDPIHFDDVTLFDKQDGDANRLDDYFEPEHFDWIHASQSLEHMDNPDDAIRRWLKVLKRGGHLVATVPDLVLYERMQWPSRFNGDHKATFSCTVKKSPAKLHYYTPDWLASIPGISVLKNELVDSHFDYSLDHSIDQTVREEDGVECWVEMVIKKI